MTTLFHAELSEREFSSHLLHVGDLLQWAESKRLHLRTSPALDGFEFAQVEALLCAIERQMQDITPEQALEIVRADPALMADPAISRYPDDISPITARWLLGAAAHKKWRELLSGAIEQHELTLLDFASKLPIDTAPAQTPAPEQAAKPDITLMATRKQLIDAFGAFTGMDIQWFNTIKDTPALLAARKVTGQGGRGHIAEPLFCPFEVLQWLIDTARRKGRPLGPAKGWELFEGHFPRAYAAFSVGDPRTD